MSDDATAIELRLTPHGVLVPAGGAAGEGAAGKGLGARFAEHEAAGLVALGAGGVPEGCGPAMMFWREVAAELLRALCHVPEGVALTPEAAEFPGAGWAAERVLNAPPMPGGEYLSPEVLGGVWERAVRWVMAQAEACGGLAGFWKPTRRSGRGWGG